MKKHTNQTISQTNYSIPHGLMARILGFHPRGPGSIPGVGDHFFSKAYLIRKIVAEFFPVRIREEDAKKGKSIMRN